MNQQYVLLTTVTVTMVLSSGVEYNLWYFSYCCKNESTIALLYRCSKEIAIFVGDICVRKAVYRPENCCKRYETGTVLFKNAL